MIIFKILLLITLLVTVWAVSSSIAYEEGFLDGRIEEKMRIKERKNKE